MSEVIDERLQAFLILVRTAKWRVPPRCWDEEFRRALSDRLVTIGFGGTLYLTLGGEYFAEHGNMEGA
jgi:hypothetical protein